MHSVEGSCQSADLVAPFKVEFGRVDFPHADRFGILRDFLHRPDHDEVEKDVHRNEQKREEADEGEEE